MKKSTKVLGLIALVAIMMFMGSCVTASSTSSTIESHGFFSGNGNGAKTVDGFTEIGAYSNWLGLFDTGYDDYISAVNAAASSGKEVRSTNTFYFIFNKVRAYAK